MGVIRWKNSDIDIITQCNLKHPSVAWKCIEKFANNLYDLWIILNFP